MPSSLVFAVTTADPASSPDSGNAAWIALVGSAVIAAVVSGLVTWFVAWRAARLGERDRVRSAFADAFRACAEYKEMPYAVRRRRADQPPDERIRLSEQLRDIQARLSYYQTWTHTECATVGAAYDRLVTAVRTQAGGAMRDAWNAAPLDNDPGMNISPTTVNLTALAVPEQQFVDAAATHLKWAGSILRRHKCAEQAG